MKRAIATAAACAALVFQPVPAVSAPDDGSIEIEITEISAVHTPGDSLPVTIEITNEGERLEEVPLQLAAQGSVPSYRTNIVGWLEGDAPSTTMLTLDSRTVDIPSGTSTIEIEVPAETLTWGNTTSSWGPRGVEATLTLEEPVTDRTFLITEPSFEIEGMDYTTLIPVTVGAEELRTIPTTAQRYQDSLDALGDGTISDREELPDPVYEAVQQAAERASDTIDSLTSPGITLALDSSLAALEYGSFNITAGALDSFTSDSAHELLLLPALDIDMSAWASTGTDRYFKTHVDQMSRTAEALSQRDIESRTDILFTPTAPSMSTIRKGLDNGSYTVVLDNEQVAPSDDLYWTPSANTTVTVSGNDVPALVTDSQLSELLIGDGNMSELDRQQMLLALTAVHYRERPNDPRPLVMSVPRADAHDVDLESINDLLEVLDDTAWLSGTTVSEIESGPTSTVARNEISDLESTYDSVTSNELHTLTNSGEAIFAIGDLTTHPHIYRDAVEATTVIVGAWSLTTMNGNVSNRVLSLQALSVELANALTVQESSTINLISQASELPVHVTSTLPFPITLTVSVDSEDRRLRFEDVTAVVQPSTTTTVGVPVRAIGSGDVTIHVQITRSEGQPIGNGTEINIRVRADWENMGTAIVAVGFFIILVIGIIRSAKRGKRSEGISEADTL